MMFSSSFSLLSQRHSEAACEKEIVVRASTGPWRLKESCCATRNDERWSQIEPIRNFFCAHRRGWRSDRKRKRSTNSPAPRLLNGNGTAKPKRALYNEFLLTVAPRLFACHPFLNNFAQITFLHPSSRLSVNLFPSAKCNMFARSPPGRHRRTKWSKPISRPKTNFWCWVNKPDTPRQARRIFGSTQTPTDSSEGTKTKFQIPPQKFSIKKLQKNVNSLPRMCDGNVALLVRTEGNSTRHNNFLLLFALHARIRFDSLRSLAFFPRQLPTLRAK